MSASPVSPPHRTPPLIRAIDGLSALFAGIAALGLILLAINIAIDLVGRNLLHRPLAGTLEMTTYWWMPTLTLLAFAFTERQQEHIKVTVLLDVLSPALRRRIEAVFGIVTLLLVAALCYYALLDAIQSTALRRTTPSNPPVAIWPFKFMAVGGMGTLTLQLVASIWRWSAGHYSAPAPEGAAARAQRIATIAFCIGLAFAAVAIGGMLFGDLSKPMIGVLVIVLSIVLLLMGVPVGMSMLGAALVGLYALSGTRVVVSTMKSVSFDAVASWSYSVIPMFILMGMMLWKSGLTASAFTAARNWLGWMPGGLAVATNFAGATLAASSGSTIGITYALGHVSIPEMLRSGYHPQLAVGSVAAAGTLGQIIPPSLLLVVYAGAAAVPVGPQLLAGIVPGLMLAAAFSVLIMLIAVARPSWAPRIDMSGVTWGMRWRSLAGVTPIAAIVFLVIGGLMSGWFTATEAGVVGMLLALVLGGIHQIRSGASLRDLWVMIRESLLGTLSGTAAIFLLIIGVVVLTRAMALSQVPNMLAQSIIDIGLGRVQLLLVLIVVYLILGMFMDTLAMMLLTIPVVVIPLQAVGVDLLWFGVFLVVMAEVGLLTPPLGILAYVVHRIAASPEVNGGKPISLSTVFLGVTPFAATAILVLLLLIAFPDLVTWLPYRNSGG